MGACQHRAMLQSKYRDPVFWLTILYALLTSLLIKKSVFTLPGLILLGVLLGFAAERLAGSPMDEAGFALEVGRYASVVVYLFPVCILSNVMSVKQYIFRRSLMPALLLSGPSYLVQVVIMTLVLSAPVDISWFEGSCMGVIVMATDSFAIHNVIHRIPERLIFQNVIQGESIIMVGFGLGLYRAFEQVHSSTSLHSTVFLLDSAKELLGGVLVSLAVFYVFNKFRARLLQSKFLFGLLIVLVCFYVCQAYLYVNGLIAVTMLGIVLVVRYKSGPGERYNRRLVDLTSNYIIVVACLLLGYMDYQNESLTLSGTLYILAVYSLHIVVRAAVIFFTNLFCKGTRFEIPRQQLLLSVFGSLKGVNNIIILFFVLNETAREVAFKLALIRFTVHIILINNLLSNFVLYRFQRFRPAANQLITLHRDSLSKLLTRVSRSIQQIQEEEILADSQQLEELAGFNMLRQFQEAGEVQQVNEARMSRRSSSITDNLLVLTDEIFVDIRLEVLKVLKRLIEQKTRDRPAECTLLNQFCEMAQQHPQQQLRLFQLLQQSLVPMRIMRWVYKLKYLPIVMFEIYKLLCEQIEFASNLAQLYHEVLQDLIMALNLGTQHRFSVEYRKKIIEEMRDEILAVQEYTLRIYQELPDTSSEILNMRMARLIISDVSSSLHDSAQFGELNEDSREEFLALFELQDAKLSNVSPYCKDLKPGTLVHKHKVFSCLSAGQIVELLAESFTLQVNAGKNLSEKKGAQPPKEIYLILKGSFSERISDICFSWKKKGQLLRIPYACAEGKPYWEQSLIADSDSQLLSIPIDRVKRLMATVPELHRRAHCKSLLYFAHRFGDKAGELLYYSDLAMRRISRDAKLVTFRNSEKVEPVHGGYVVSGELVSEQTKRNYLQGVNRYDQFSYVPPRERLVCMRQTLLLIFQERPYTPRISEI